MVDPAPTIEDLRAQWRRTEEVRTKSAIEFARIDRERIWLRRQRKLAFYGFAISMAVTPLIVLALFLIGGGE